MDIDGSGEVDYKEFEAWWSKERGGSTKLAHALQERASVIENMSDEFSQWHQGMRKRNVNASTPAKRFYLV